MSVVTNVILCVPLDEDTYIESIQRWLIQNKQPQLMEVARHWPGSKTFESHVYVGAYNYLEVEKFIGFVKTLRMVDDIGAPQLFIQGQDEDVFTERLAYPGSPL